MDNIETNYFKKLYAIDVNEKTEKKNGLSYLPWAVAWAEVKKEHPDATYTVYETENSRPWFDDGRTGWVKTGVTVNGIEHIERLPIMDFKNKSISADSISSMDANKAIQRSLTKACGRHGVGLYIYEGEDLPEETKKKVAQKSEEEAKKEDALKEIAQEIIKIAGEKTKHGVDKELVYQTIADISGKKNPNSIKDIAIANKVLDAVKKLEVA